MKRFFLLLFTLGLTHFLYAQQKKLPQLGKASIEQVIRNMTLEEKASMLIGVATDSENNMVASAAGTTVAIPRLGIPHTYLQDGPTGLRIDSVRPGDSKKYYTTGFPVSILMAATWNTDLAKRVGSAMGEEVCSFGLDVLLAPALNIQRNPLCGRNFEYYSEDPLLSGYMAGAAVQGLQSRGAGATIKHFAANSQQSMRMFNDARISQRALREIYLRNFEIAVREAKPWAVMSSYNSINGQRAQSHHGLLTTLLRKEWGFDGFVVTDWGDPRITKDQIYAGNDLLMPGKPSQITDIVEAVRKGELDEKVVDEAVRRMLRYILRSNSFKGKKADFNPDLKGHALLAREAAAEGIVLLKNEGKALPLAKDKQIALFGVGNYNFFANGLGSADVFKPYVINLQQGLLAAGVPIHPRLDKYYRQYLANEDWQLAEANKPSWKNWFFGYKKPQEARIETSFITYRAKDCDKAVITIARNAGECEDRDYKEGDYLLTAAEKQLIADVSRIFHAQRKPVIVVLNVGGAIEISSWSHQVDAIVMAWQPGMEGGNAVADILTGKVNPSGKLPITLALQYEDYPSAANFPLHYKFSWDELLRPGKKVMETKNLGYTCYEEDIWVGYRHFNTFAKPVAYPFGYGLSYTTFNYGACTIKQQRGRCYVNVEITNTGEKAGKEVVQLYATAPAGKLKKPTRELKAFAKTPLLQPGEKTTLTLEFPIADLASFDEEQMAWVTEAGTYTLSIGASVEDIRNKVQLKVAKPLIKKVQVRI